MYLYLAAFLVQPRLKVHLTASALRGAAAELTPSLNEGYNFFADLRSRIRRSGTMFLSHPAGPPSAVGRAKMVSGHLGGNLGPWEVLTLSDALHGLTSARCRNQKVARSSTNDQDCCKEYFSLSHLYSSSLKDGIVFSKCCLNSACGHAGPLRSRGLKTLDFGFRRNDTFYKTVVYKQTSIKL
jgi:hypothetical protein